MCGFQDFVNRSITFVSVRSNVIETKSIRFHFITMTTKELISILASQANKDIKSIYSAEKTKKSRYALRPIRKVTKKKHTKSQITTASIKKGKLCCMPNSVVLHKLPTSVPVTTVIDAKENLPKNDGLQNSSQTPSPDTNMDVDEFIQDADFINISDVVRLLKVFST